MVKNLSILGSTGSIGKQSLCVAKNLNINITALTANKNIKLLEEQIREFKPKLAVVFDEQSAKDLKIKIADTNTKVSCKMDGLIEAATQKEADTVLNSVVSMIGLKPTLAAINEKKDIALANKETLVVGGELVINEVKKNQVKLLPVDSEHSAIFQCLQGCEDKKELKKIILTASGGPFFRKKKNELRFVTARDALKHPTWNMGAKITIDSATLMNKGLEVIEAKWLFGVELENIDVLVHKQSIIHSMVEFNDNSVIAQLGVADMRLPIQYALTYPERYSCPVEELDLAKIYKLTFEKPDEDTFLCLKACKEAIKIGGLAPAAVNAANEVAVDLFLKNKITFLDIGKCVYETLNKQKPVKNFTLEDILEIDKTTKEEIKSKFIN